MLVNKIFPAEYNAIFRRVVNSGTLDEEAYNKVHSVLDWSVMDKARDTGMLTYKEYDAVFTALHDNIWNAPEAERRLGRPLPEGFVLSDLQNVSSDAGTPFFVSPSAFSTITQRNHFKSADEYFKEKMGLYTQPENSADKQQMFDDGHDFEEAFAKAFARKTGIMWIPSPFTYWNEDYPNVLYNTDGWLVEIDENGKAHIGLYEGKTTRFNSRTKECFDRGEVPDYYLDQLCGYFAGLPFVEFAYINCGWGINSATNMKYIRVDRQESYIDYVMSDVLDFIEDAKLGIPPIIRGGNSEAIKASAKKLYSTGDDSLPTVNLSGEFGKKAKQITEFKAQIEAAKKEREELLEPLSEKIKEIEKNIKGLEDDKATLLDEFYGVMGNATSGVCSFEGKEYTVSYPAAKEPKFDKDSKKFLKDAYGEAWDALMEKFSKRGSLTVDEKGKK